MVKERAKTGGTWRSRMSDFEFGFCFNLIYLIVLAFDCVSEYVIGKVGVWPKMKGSGSAA